MDFYGLDILGAVSVSEAKKQRSAAAGQRAVAAGQKLAKRVPRLSAAIVAAGQKAIGAAKAKPPTQPAGQPAAATVPTQQTAQRRVPRSVAPPAPAPRKRGVRLGEDATEEGSERQADIYAQLADAAASVANFIGYFQGLLDQLPPSTPLAEQGIGTMSQFENWFGAPLEAALQGDQAALQKVPDIYGVLEHFKGQGEAAEKRWPWDWAARAETYLKLHPAAQPAADGSAAAPGQAPTGATVAKAAISPKSIAVAPNAPQQFIVVALDASGKSATPANPIAWSANNGATIDANGSFTATTPGRYTVSANVDGVTATATVFVQANLAAPTPGSGSAGGGGSGSGYDSGGSGRREEVAYSEDGGEEVAYQEEAPPPDMYAEEEYPEEPRDELGQLEAVLGRGGRGGGRGHGGGRHHHCRGDQGGPFYWGGPWPYWGVEQVEPFDEPTLDEVAEAVAHKLAKKRVAVGGLDCLGSDAIGVDLLDWRTPGDYRNAVAQLKVSADNLDQTAASVPGWKAIYDNALALHEKYKDAGWLNTFSLSDSTWYAIADAQKRVGEFAAQMRAQGKPVVEPPHTPPPQGGSLGGVADWAKDHWVGLAVGGVALVTLPAVLPPIIGAVAMSRVRR